MECKSQFCLPPAITGGCCQPPGSKFALSNNPNLRPGSSSAPKKHPKCGESFEFRGFPGLFFRCQQGYFWERRRRWVYSFGGAEVRSCGGLGGILGQNKWLLCNSKSSCKGRDWLGCLTEPFSRLHHTFNLVHSTIKLIIVSPIHQHLCVKASLRFSTLVF